MVTIWPKNIPYTTHCYSIQRYRNSSFKTDESSSPLSCIRILMLKPKLGHQKYNPSQETYPSRGGGDIFKILVRVTPTRDTLMFISSKDYFQEFSETSIVMTYPARAWYVASDEEFSLLGPFPCVAVGRHFLPETISSELGLERTFSYPRWELIYAMQPALTLPQSLFPVQKMSFTANLQIIRIFQPC